MKTLTQTIRAEIAFGHGFMTDGLLPEYSRRQVARALQGLIDRGQAFPVRLGKEARYFGSREGANDWLASQLDARASETRRAPEDRAPWSDTDPAHYPTNADGTPAYAVTRCPPDQTGLLRTNTFSDLY